MSLVTPDSSSPLPPVMSLVTPDSSSPLPLVMSQVRISRSEAQKLSLEASSLSQIKVDLEVKLRAMEASLEGAMRENERVRGAEMRTGEECLMLRRALDKASVNLGCLFGGLWRDKGVARKRSPSLSASHFSLTPSLSLITVYE